MGLNQAINSNGKEEGKEMSEKDKKDYQEGLKEMQEKMCKSSADNMIKDFNSDFGFYLVPVNEKTEEVRAFIEEISKVYSMVVKELMSKLNSLAPSIAGSERPRA